MKNGIVLGSRILLVAIIASLAATPAFSQGAAKPDDRAAIEKAIRAADAEWSKVAMAKNVDATVSYYADDATLLPPNAPMATNKNAIRALWVDMFAAFSLSWNTTKVDVSRSGDMAYTLGTYQASFIGPDGKPANDHGKYLEVWKKQSNGKWKVVVDTYNSDVPLPAPPPPAKKPAKKN